MRVAVTGTTGRVGAALAARLAENHEIIALPRRGFDLADPRQMARRLAELRCDAILNPAGMTSLEACEDAPAAAARANAEAPAEIAAWAARHGVRMVHFSTDYVFDGGGTDPLTEETPANPLSIYGRTKLAGEQAVLAHPGHCVIRVSWVFGPEKPAFPDQVFEAALAGEPLAAIADKFSLPVLTTELAHWVEILLARPFNGLVHACQSGPAASWHDMATAVVAEMARCGVLPELPTVRPLALAEMTGFRAPRPVFSAMDTGRLAGILGHAPRPWREVLAGYIRRRCSTVRRE